MSALLTAPLKKSPPLLTAEEFAEQYSGHRMELVDGRPVETPMPNQRHGKICGMIGFFLTLFCRAKDFGHVMTCDTFVIVKRDPDAMRCADVYFISYSRLAKGSVPGGILDVIPELVFEVESPSDRPGEISTKISEYLAAGVSCVVSVDPETESATAHRIGRRPKKYNRKQIMNFPDILPGFDLPLAELFA